MIYYTIQCQTILFYVHGLLSMSIVYAMLHIERIAWHNILHWSTPSCNTSVHILSNDVHRTVSWYVTLQLAFAGCLTGDSFHCWHKIHTANVSSKNPHNQESRVEKFGGLTSTCLGEMLAQVEPPNYLILTLWVALKTPPPAQVRRPSGTSGRDRPWLKRGACAAGDFMPEMAWDSTEADGDVMSSPAEARYIHTHICMYIYIYV